MPWDQANTKHSFKLELLDADGKVVTAETPDGEKPIGGEGQLEVGRPPGVNPGTPLAIPLALNFSPAPPIPAGGQYVRQLGIDGVTDDDWRARRGPTRRSRWRRSRTTECGREGARPLGLARRPLALGRVKLCVKSKPSQAGFDAVSSSR